MVSFCLKDGFMIRVVFKNLEKSELAREAVIQRIESVVEKFPHLKHSQIRVTLEMENSPVHAGPDSFSVRVLISGGEFSRLRLEKSAPNLYAALAEIVEGLLQKFNQLGDRSRVRQRSKARAIIKKSSA